MKNSNTFVKVAVVVGIIAGAIVGLVLILNILAFTVGSNILTNIVKEQIGKNGVKLPFSFSGVSVNPLFGEIAFSDIYFSSGEKDALDIKCRSVKLRANPADIVGFATNPANGNLRSVNLTLQEPAMQMPGQGLQVACNELSLDADGDFTQELLASVSGGNLLPLFDAARKVRIVASGIDFSFIKPDLDSMIRPLLQKAFDFGKADIEIVSDPASGMLEVKSGKFSSSAFEGTLEGKIALDKSDIFRSRLVDCRLSGTIKDETLKSFFLKVGKDQPGLVKVEGDNVELFVSGTLAKPVLHK
jgi:hypothetical protein